MLSDKTAFNFVSYFKQNHAMDLKYIKNASKENVDLYIYDSIGEEIKGSDFAREIRLIEDTEVKRINVRINSGGGIVVDGFSIWAALKNSSKEVHTFNDGLAASMAGILLMAGKVIHAANYSQLMIHPVSGGSEQGRKALQDSLVMILSKRSGNTKEEITEMMIAETWLSAKEAKKKGFVDEIFEGINKYEVNLKAAAEIFGESIEIENPYPNEHSARIVEPSKFEKDSFRRKKISEGINLILGRLNGETTMTTQAYRFDKENFSVSQAKKWLIEHKIKYILFEPASAETKTFLNMKTINNLLKLDENVAKDVTEAKVKEILTNLTALEAANKTLKETNVELKTESDKFKTEKETVRKESVKNQIEKAITDGSLKADKKDELIAEFGSNVEMTEKFISSIQVTKAPDIKNEIDGIKNDKGKTTYKGKTMRELEKSGEAEALKNENEKLFYKIFKEEYGEDN